MLEELLTQDSGNYTCTVCNSLGCIEHTTKVDVIGELRVLLGLFSNVQPLFSSTRPRSAQQIELVPVLKLKCIREREACSLALIIKPCIGLVFL